ncbi:nicotinate-nucleotide adenylyltransferase [Marinospirillum sp. MEB164]|uniref:Probable nicotinate-nucleotide adenylyltransferase n=1 Tax=Marinospirillum alkalitolerans TaxID=3123374 RepID=A0ABW8PYV8_9GAMM
MVISASNEVAAQSSGLVLMYGGTFDPVHCGHLRSALELTQCLPIQRVHWIPCQVPPHRPQPQASGAARLAMLHLATADEPLFYVDDRELRRAGPSWSVETLEALRAEYGPHQPLAMLLGWDAYLGLLSWSRTERLLDLAHLVVIARPGTADQEPEALRAWSAERRVRDPEQLSLHPAGSVLHITLPSQLQISASFLRQGLRQQRSMRYLTPDSVLHYIQEHQLYVADVV